MSETAWIVVGLIALVIALGILSSLRKKERLAKRKKELETRFGTQVAELIMARKIVEGMTEEMLAESWGSPADIDQQVFKTKVKQTWKYNPVGKNRFANRVYVENGVVVGWKNS